MSPRLISRIQRHESKSPPGELDWRSNRFIQRRKSASPAFSGAISCTLSVSGVAHFSAHFGISRSPAATFVRAKLP